MFLLLIALCVAPGLLLLAYFYVRDRYETEPIGMVVRQFAVGSVAFAPIFLIENWIQRDGSLLYHGFIVSSLVEEATFFLLIFFGIFHNREFDEEYDGIIYAVALGLGFATVENVFYVLSNPTWTAAALRAFFPVPGHALFEAMMGYYMGRAKFSLPGTARRWLLARAFCYPWIIHGIYDVTLLVGGVWSYLAAAIIAGLWWNVVRKMKSAVARSFFRSQETGSDV